MMAIFCKVPREVADTVAGQGFAGILEAACTISTMIWNYGR